MIKLLGYDFVTKEKVKWFKQKDMIIDDVAVIRRNRQPCQHQRSGSSVEDGNQPTAELNRRRCRSMQPDSLSMGDDCVSLCSMISEPATPLDECDEDFHQQEPQSPSASFNPPQLTSASRSSSISAGSTTSVVTGRRKLFALARKSFKVPFANFRRMSEPGVSSLLKFNCVFGGLW